MARRTEIEQQRLAVAKSVRSAIRLKHALAADAEVNDVLPDVLDQFDRAIAAGEPFTLNLRSVLDAG